MSSLIARSRWPWTAVVLQLGGAVNRLSDAEVGGAATEVAAIAASMSASVGFGVLASSAAADMIWPAWQ